IQNRIAELERLRLAEVEQGLRVKFAREQQQAAVAAKAAIEQAKKDATKAAEQQIKALRAKQETLSAQRVHVARETLEKKMSESVVAERVRAFGEKAKLTQRLANLQRKLEQKTAHQLGEPAEVDLFETLRAAFPSDRVS